MTEEQKQKLLTQGRGNKHRNEYEKKVEGKAVYVAFWSMIAVTMLISILYEIKGLPNVGLYIILYSGLAIMFYSYAYQNGKARANKGITLSHVALAIYHTVCAARGVIALLQR